MSIIIWLTWTPTGSGSPDFVIVEGANLRDVIGNLFLFAPISVIATTGILVPGSRLSPSARSRRAEWHIVTVVTAAAAVTSILVELGQSMVPGRTVSAVDPIVNAAGGFLAAIATVRSFRYARDGKLVSAVTVCAVFTGVLVFLVAAGHEVTQTMTLSDWDWSNSEVIAGDEVGGGRRYVGTVSSSIICAGNPSNEVCGSPGAGPEIRQRLAWTARTSQRVRLEAIVTSRSDTQTGPTRIVSFSRSWFRRNATLGQEGKSLQLRLRTRASGLNGTGIVFALPEAVPTGAETRAFGEYQPGRVSLRSETDGSVREAEYRWGFLNGWEILRSRPKTIADPQRLAMASMIAAFALSFPIGILAGVLPTALTFRASASIIAPPLLLTLIVLPLGGHLVLGELLWCALSGGIAILLTLGDLHWRRVNCPGSIGDPLC